MKNLLLTIFSSLLLVNAVHSKTTASLERIPVSDVAGYLSNGNFEVKQFVARNGQLWALGQLTGIVSGKHVTRSLQMPVTLTAGTPEQPNVKTEKSGYAAQVSNGKKAASPAVACDLLNLAFGPVDVTVLGFDLSIAPVDIDLTAEDAPADILCAITNLLGAVTGVVNTIASLLNAILGGLGGL